MSDQELESLRAEIVRAYGSVHRFCLASGISSGTVSLLLRGIYPGRVERMVARVRAALDDGAPAEAVRRALQEAACRRCTVRTRCHACDGLFAAQADAVVQMLDRAGWHR